MKVRRSALLALVATATATAPSLMPSSLAFAPSWSSAFAARYDRFPGIGGGGGGGGRDRDRDRDGGSSSSSSLIAPPTPSSPPKARRPQARDKSPSSSSPSPSPSSPSSPLPSLYDRIRNGAAGRAPGSSRPRTQDAAMASSATATDLPVLDDWRLLINGAVVGTVSNHVTIDDGDVVTTSPLVDPTTCEPGSVVTTMSGSNYRLGARFVSKRRRGALFEVLPSRIGTPSSSSTAADDAPPNGSSRINGVAVPLTGQAVGPRGKYLLAGDAARSTSGKSSIYSAYRSNRGNPRGDVLTIKVSSHRDAIERENDNYEKVAKGLFGGLFVQKVEYLPNVGPDFDESCAALVLRTGTVDLKGLMAERQYVGLDGKAMRNAAYRAAKTVQAMHGAELVWTDLKAENFVLMPDSEDMAGMVAIDLESAMRKGDVPVDYSPEACPPEFAESFVRGDVESFVLDFSYDIWSYGMLMYELGTGKPYFAGKTPAEITKELKDENFNVDLGEVSNPQLRGLIRMCLQKDPEKRPTIFQVLLHPFFLTSGFGRISF